MHRKTIRAWADLTDNALSEDIIGGCPKGTLSFYTTRYEARITRFSRTQLGNLFPVSVNIDPSLSRFSLFICIFSYMVKYLIISPMDVQSGFPALFRAQQRALVRIWKPVPVKTEDHY